MRDYRAGDVPMTTSFPVTGLLKIIDELDAYQKRPDNGGYGVECICCRGELFNREDREVIESARKLGDAQGQGLTDDIRWQRVNDEPFEYAIQQGAHGDEFVKLLNGNCLRRALTPAPGTREALPKPITYGYSGKGDIVLPIGAPFDGDPVLARFAAGWCEARWEPYDRDADDGFCWVCLDDSAPQQELDDAKEWMPLPVALPQGKQPEGTTCPQAPVAWRTDIENSPKDRPFLVYWKMSDIYGVIEWIGDKWVDQEGDEVMSFRDWSLFDLPSTAR
jgi:hypothetical protein